VSAPLDVLTLADEGFVLPLAVLVRSILDRLGPHHRLRLTVVDGGLTGSSRERLSSSWSDPRLEVVWRVPEFGDAASLPVAGRIPPLTYARLTVAELVPSDCERVIVLDADQLVLADLGRLAAEPFDGAHVLAPRDAFIPCMSSPNGLAGYAELGLAPDAPYLTGALMVVNVPAWRADGITERALAYVAKHGPRLRNYDQDALNAVLAGRWRRLDPRWQVQPRVLGLSSAVTPHLDAAARTRLAADAWVVHFSGRLKPWLYEGSGPFDAAFREVLVRTTFRGYRAPRDARGLLYRLYDGRIRRWVYPLEVRVHAGLRRLRRRRAPVARTDAAPPPTHGHPPRLWSALVLAAAVAGLFFRLAWIDQRLREVPRRGGWRGRTSLEEPLSRAPWLHDEQLYYLSTAVNAYRGRGFLPDYNRVRDGVYVPPPLLSALILIVFRLAGSLVEPATLLGLQACAAALMIVLVAELGRRLASPAAGVACAFLAALYPDFILWTGYLLTESTYLCAFVLLALLLTRWAQAPTIRRAMGAAILLGFMNLLRPNALWLPPILALFAVAVLGRRRGLAAAATFLLVPLAVLVPWRQRNVATYGEPIWVSSNMGVYMYVANNPRLDILDTPYMDEANRGRRLLLPRIERRLRQPDGRLRVTYYAYSQAYLGAFRGYLKDHPMHFARNYALKMAAQFWLVPTSEPLAALLRIPPRAYALAQRLLVGLGLMGFLLLLRPRPSPAMAVCALLFVYFAAAGALAGVDRAARYTVVLRLLLIVFAAAGVARLAERWRAASPRAALSSPHPACAAGPVP
jgi:lipopolysaccharide biosynthesis glycosyltransferase